MAGSDRAPGDPSFLTHPRHVRAFGTDWYGDKDFDAGEQIETVLGDSLVTEPVMAGSALDMIGDTMRLDLAHNRQLGRYDTKNFLGIRWRELTPLERHKPKPKPKPKDTRPLLQRLGNPFPFN